MTTAVSLAQQVAPGVSLGFKNRIINGGMVIDQRNSGGAFGTSNNGYTLDRWNFQENQTGKFNGGQNYNSVTPPVGFTKYIGFQSQSAFSPAATDYFDLAQVVEGNNIADLAWGTANAKTVTVSFWAYSSLTGTFSGSICTPTGSYSYVFTYSLPVANTWTYVTATIAGPSVGTWATDNTGGLNLRPIDLGSGSNYRTSTIGSWVSGNYNGSTGSVSVVGTNGATFYLTGVQLEVGTAATNFEFRDYGRELILCQRYYTKLGWMRYDFYMPATTDDMFMPFPLPVAMRDTPSVTVVGQGTSMTGVSYGNSNNTVFNLFSSGEALGSNYWYVSNVLLSSEL